MARSRSTKRALNFDATNRTAIAKAAELEKTIRDRVEAARPKPRILELQQQAQRLNAPPLLNPASREPLRVNFNNSSLRDILNFIGATTGINITYDQQFVDKPFTVSLDGVTIEEALQQVLSANQYYYKVVNPRTIIIIPDQPAKHTQYDELVVRVFYISHADATELAQIVNTIMRIPQLPLPPMVMPNKTANTITVRATAPVVEVIDRIIRANDKPRAEVVLDVEILEVDRERIKRYGINLSQYNLNILFSPEVAPPNTGGGTVTAPPPFNLNTISQGVSTADFYLGVPTAVVNFLESDSHSRTLAKPQLRGTEGQKMTLNLGQQVPVISTVFGAAAAGGFATIPQSSYNYKDVGVNMDITPRVTYEGEVILDMALENNSLGQNIDVAGQSIPSFNSRRVSTHLRLREGESNLLAGLIGEDERRNIQGFPGLIHVPGFKQILSGNDIDLKNTDIVMLITPHVVRTHELTSTDLGSIYIGTQQNVGLGGPPPLIAPQGEAAGVGGAPASTPSVANQPPNFPPGGVASPGGVPPTNLPAPPGTSPVPGMVSPVATLPAPGLPPPPVTPEAGAAPPAVNPNPNLPATTPTTTEQPPTAPSPNVPNPVQTSPAGQPPTASPLTPAQIIVSPPGTTFQVAGGPYTMPVSINNAARVSVVTLDDYLQPGSAARTHGAGRHVHAAGRGDRLVHASHRRCVGAGRYRGDAGRVIRPERPERDCWRH